MMQTLPIAIQFLKAHREPVLDWLESLQVANSEFRYRFSAGADDSLFSSCFALFVLDLFRGTDRLSPAQRDHWSDYINAHQNPRDGLFYPDPVLHNDAERSVYQLTTFALSALAILERERRYPLRVVDGMADGAAVRRYLDAHGVSAGRRGSGNRAMFLGILLTHALRDPDGARFKAALDEWFAYHEASKNDAGLWGSERAVRSYRGVQNAFHQLVVYDYWRRTYSGIEQAARVAARMQDPDGFFAPDPGGGACYDFDAVYFILSGVRQGHVIDGLDSMLNRTVQGVATTATEHGGFCENQQRERPLTSRLSKGVRHLVAARSPADTEARIRAVARGCLSSPSPRGTGWVVARQRYREATLWSTWFRCLLVAEIAAYQAPEAAASLVQFHPSIGIGYRDPDLRLEQSPAQNRQRTLV